MSHKPFLKQIAEIYASLTDDERRYICFIFPNKRSKTFFGKYYSEALGDKENISTSLTISEFVANFSRYKEASRYDLIFTLFNEYRKIAGEEHLIDFERFAFWGEMLLSDFNDVDRYLVDPEKIFINVKEFKEIGTNYLTDEQFALIRKYLGDDEIAYKSQEAFWKHYQPEGDKRVKQEFIRLWSTLAPLYRAFHSSLNNAGLTTSGAIFRNAANILDNDPKGLRSSRYVFIGFNVLTPAEKKIFNALKKRGIADFYWDFNSPAFADNLNRATRFIADNAKEFPSRYPLEEEPITTMPEIEVIGVPGDNAQAKAAGKMLQELLAKKAIENPDDAIDTAIVLPDESLFLPLLRSIPDEIGTVNVTMGLGLRNNPIASLFASIVRLQQNSRITGRGEVNFFREDVNAIVNNPVLADVYPDECEKIAEYMIAERIFRITEKAVEEKAQPLASIFRRINDENIDETCNYLIAIVDMLEQATRPDDLLRFTFLAAYREKVEMICSAIKRHDVSMMGNTAIRMVQRAVSMDKITLAGEPLNGLQIMGVLETRALDFNNVIMLSMNEKTFPKKHYSASFIPDTIRQGYGLPTTEFQENIFAYYFYRLISRANKVKLIYDARTVGVDTGEMSRYLSQILYLFNDGRISHRMMKFNIIPDKSRTLEVAKTPEVMNKIRLFSSTASDARNLNATSLKEYINCPLNFYLRFVENFNPHDDPEDYVDSGTYGTIIHDIMKAVYDTLLGSQTTVTVNATDIDSLLNPANPTVDRAVTEAVNHLYRMKPKGTYDKLTGESMIYGQVFAKVVKMILGADREITPFNYHAGEKKMEVRYDVNPGLTVNILQIIDRIDEDNTRRRRLVDYKTGSDELVARDLDSLFVHTPGKNVKAIFQLLLYCCVYARSENFEGAIKPLIYSIKNIAKGGVANLKIGDKEVEDYRDFADDFQTRLRGIIAEIFDPNVPFRQSTDPDSCLFCRFMRICGRNETQLK